MSSRSAIFPESNTKNGKRAGLREEKPLYNLFSLEASSLHLLGLQGKPLLLDHSINCLPSASELSDVSHTGDIILESSAYLTNIGSSKRSTLKSLLKNTK